MHWPIPLPPTRENYPLLPSGDRNLLPEDEWSYIDTWRSMQRVLRTGKCKAIGVSNMSVKYLEGLVGDEECVVVPAVNQVSPPLGYWVFLRVASALPVSTSLGNKLVSLWHIYIYQHAYTQDANDGGRSNYIHYYRKTN